MLAYFILTLNASRPNHVLTLLGKDIIVPLIANFYTECLKLITLIERAYSN